MKDIPGYEGLYAITEDGQVWSYTTNKFLKPHTQMQHRHNNSNGYECTFYILTKNKKPKIQIAARLVAITYIPNPQNLPEVDHIDRDSTNNNVANLRWVTHSDNCKNRDNKNSNFIAAQRRNALEKRRPVVQIDMQTNEIINTFSSACEAACVLFNDVNKNGLINMCANHKKKSAYGYYWKFI